MFILHDIEREDIFGNKTNDNDGLYFSKRKKRCLRERERREQWANITVCCAGGGENQHPNRDSRAAEIFQKLEKNLKNHILKNVCAAENSRVQEFFIEFETSSRIQKT